jgi:hypothetical protein
MWMVVLEYCKMLILLGNVIHETTSSLVQRLKDQAGNRSKHNLRGVGGVLVGGAGVAGNVYISGNTSITGNTVDMQGNVFLTAGNVNQQVEIRSNSGAGTTQGRWL